MQPYGPPLRQSRDALIEALRTHLGSEAKASVKFQQILALQPYPSPAYRLLYLGDTGLDQDKLYVLPNEFSADAGLAPLRRRGIDYVVLKRSTLFRILKRPAWKRRWRGRGDASPSSCPIEPRYRRTNTAWRLSSTIPRQ